MTRNETIMSSIVLIAVGVLARLLPHMANFAPVTATALFCGAFMSRRQSLAVLLAVMLVSDYLLLYFEPFGGTHFDRLYAPTALYYDTLPFVYLSFGISALVGWLLRTHRLPLDVATAALFCSVQFFLITNAAVWLMGAYDRGLGGLWQSYEAGIPFFRGTLFGDLFYTAALFGLYELARLRRPVPIREIA